MRERDVGEPAVDEASVQYQALIELLSDAVVLLQHEGRQVVAANTAAAQLLGHSRAALTSMTLDDLCDPTEVPRLDTAFMALTTVNAARGVWRIRQHSGEI